MSKTLGKIIAAAIWALALMPGLLMADDKPPKDGWFCSEKWLMFEAFSPEYSYNGDHFVQRWHLIRLDDVKSLSYRDFSYDGVTYSGLLAVSYSEGVLYTQESVERTMNWFIECLH